jgi:putative serine protease PepD
MSLRHFSLGAAALLYAMISVSGCTKPAATPTPSSGLARQEINTASSVRIDTLDEHGKTVGHGSGVVVSHEGHILTACHVVCDAAAVSITIELDGPYPFVFEAELVDRSRDWDLALIKIDHDFAHYADVMAADDVYAVQPVYMIGYPNNYGQTVTAGRVMLRHLRQPIEPDQDKVRRNALLLDLTVGYGNSGSAVFDAQTGSVVGIALEIEPMDSPYPFPLSIMTVAAPPEKICPFLERSSLACGD